MRATNRSHSGAGRGGILPAGRHCRSRQGAGPDHPSGRVVSRQYAVAVVRRRLQLRINPSRLGTHLREPRVRSVALCVYERRPCQSTSGQSGRLVCGLPGGLRCRRPLFLERPGVINQSRRWGLNPRPTDYKSVALPLRHTGKWPQSRTGEYRQYRATSPTARADLGYGDGSFF